MSIKRLREDQNTAIEFKSYKKNENNIKVRKRQMDVNLKGKKKEKDKYLVLKSAHTPGQVKW